jgi:uncharacterized delta-60 repeat protein
MASRRLASWVPVLALALACAGCGNGADDDDSSGGTDTSITINEERDSFSGESEHSWDAPGSAATVSVEIRNFHHGSVLVTVLDALGAAVFAQLYEANDWFWYIDGQLTDVDVTAPGAAGAWTIDLDYSELTGDVTVVVDASDAPPPDPSVPPPDSISVLLDSSFGTAGRAAYEPDTTAGRRLAIDSLGRVVACGGLLDGAGGRRLAVWRYTADGILDRSFDDDGISIYEDGTASGALDIAVDSINRVLVAGWVAPGPDRRTDLAVFRFTSLGSLDATFNDDGLMTLDDGEDEAGAALAVDSIGRILVAGTSRNEEDTAGHVLLLRLLSSGRLDSSFDGDGVVRTSDGTDRARDMTLAPGDQPLILGTRTGNLALWKFTSGGGLDGSFGSGGIVTGPGAPGELRVGAALAIKGDGTLGIAGVRYHDDGSGPPALALWRYEANGSPLLTFNTSGFLAYEYPDGWAAGTGVGFDAGGQVLVSGATRSSSAEESDASATLWRYFNSGAVDLALPGSDGTGASRFDLRPQDAGTAASSFIILGDGKVLASGAAFSRDTNAVDLVLWKLDP